MAIDQHGSQPLSAQVMDDIRQKISSEEFPVGKKIPSLRALSEAYGVAELTVHAAIRELQHVGVLKSVSGRGTFVVQVPDPPRESSEDPLASLAAEVAELRERVEALESDSDR